VLYLFLILLIALGVFLAATNFWAWHNYRAAGQAMHEGDYQSAKTYLGRCLTFWPGDAQAHFWMARTLRWQGRFDEAEEHLQRSENLEWAPSALEMERTLLSAQQGRFDEFEALLISWAKEDNEDTAAVQEVLIHYYAHNSQLDQALNWGRRFLEFYPDHILVLNTMALLHKRLQNSTDCLRCYRRLLELRPRNDEFRESYATALLQFNEPQRAIRQYRHLLSSHPESVTILLGLAHCRRSLGNFDEARRILAPLVSKHPNEGHVLSELGKLRLTEKRPLEAEKWLKKSLAIDPRDKSTLFTLYLCLKQQGKGREHEANKYFALHQQAEKDIKRLAELTGRAIAKDPRNPAIPYEIGIICLRFGDTDNGIYWLKKALEVKPWYGKAHLALAKHYERIGNARLSAKHRAFANGQIRTR
jgi:tetratricopeptide (TPR) repeat protein